MQQIRRWHALRVTDLHTLRIPMRRALPFVITADHNPAAHAIDAVDLVVKLQDLTGRRIKPEAFKSVRTVGDVVECVHALMNTDAA